MNSIHEDLRVASSSADDHAMLVTRLKYHAPTLLRLDLARVIAGPGGSQFDDGGEVTLPP